MHLVFYFVRLKTEQDAKFLCYQRLGVQKITQNKLEKQLKNVPTVRKTMKTYEFTIVLEGVNDFDDQLVDQVFEAGCDDASLCSRSGVVYLDFDREAASFTEAIWSAIKQVETIQEPKIRVDSVQPDDLVTASEIARRLGKSREYVRLLINGERGAGNFPLPLSGVQQKSMIWSWLKVSRWLLPQNLVSAEDVLNAQDIADINSYLLNRDNLADFQRRMQKIEENLLTV